jgi:hypothetical protein
VLFERERFWQDIINGSRRKRSLKECGKRRKRYNAEFAGFME